MLVRGMLAGAAAKGAVVLFNTRCLNAVITKLRAGGYEVGNEDAVRLSPFGRHHVNLLGRYSFLLPADLGRSLRPLRDPDAVDSDDEDEDEDEDEA